MATGVAAKRYAQAAFQLAQEHDALDQWAQDFAQASSATSNDEYRAFLEHAKVPLERKQALIAEALPDVSPLMRNLMAVLVSRGLVKQISDIELEYLSLLDKHRERIRVEVTAAVTLDDGQQANITRLLQDLTQRAVVLSTRVDPSILGGLILRIEDRLIDGSTRARLNGLRRNMVGAG